MGRCGGSVWWCGGVRSRRVMRAVICEKVRARVQRVGAVALE